MQAEQYPLFLAEDAALKAQFEGFSVTGRDSQQYPVKVFFRWPETETVDRVWPFITIDLVDVRRASQREHRGRIEIAELGYKIHGYPDYHFDATPPDVPEIGQWWVNSDQYRLYQWDGTEWRPRSYKIDYPIPYDFIYQVTSHARYWSHDREIWLQMMRFGARDRYATIQTDTTWRRVDVQAMTPADTRDENNRRIFRKTMVLAVASELPEEFDESQIGGRVEEIRGVIRDLRDPSRFPETSWNTVAEPAEA